MTTIARAEQERNTWLAERHKGVGASECAAILGIHPWLTALQVYFDKLGLSVDRATPRMKWGLRLQRAIADAYAEETGRPIIEPPPILSHPEAPWMLASLDYLAGDDRVLEVKKVSAHAAHDFGPSGSSEIPEYYALQVQQQMACAGKPLADLAALIGDDDFRIYTIEFQPAIIARLVEVEWEFMDRVQRQDPPLPDFQHPSTAELLAMIEPVEGTAIELTAQHAELVDLFERFGAEARELEADRKNYKAQLIHAMGTAETAYLPDGRKLTRKTVERKGYTVEPSSYIDFRVRQATKGLVKHVE